MLRKLTIPTVVLAASATVPLVVKAGPKKAMDPAPLGAPPAFQFELVLQVPPAALFQMLALLPTIVVTVT